MGGELVEVYVERGEGTGCGGCIGRCTGRAERAWVVPAGRVIGGCLMGLVGTYTRLGGRLVVLGIWGLYVWMVYMQYDLLCGMAACGCFGAGVVR